ncbi:MAG: hypothetical protein Q8P12_04100 [bacterium]|nr:hypothetical protein [bacterium]
MDLWTGAFNGYRALNAELTPLQKHQFFVDVCRDFPEVGNGEEDVRAELPLEEMEVLMKKYGIETNRMPGERYMPEESYQIVEKIIQEAEEKKSCRTI